jgi:hypothetical protein
MRTGVVRMAICLIADCQEDRLIKCQTQEIIIFFLFLGLILKKITIFVKLNFVI